MGGPVDFTGDYHYKNSYVPKHITVDMGQSNLGRVGENLSSRMVLTVENEAGKQIKGFFTENEYISTSKTFHSRFRPVYSNPANRAFQALHDKMVKNGQLFGNKSLLNDMYSSLGEQGAPNSMEDLKNFSKQANRGINGTVWARRAWDEKKENLLNFLKSQQPEVAPADELDKMAKNPQFLPYMVEMMSAAQGAHLTTVTHVGLHKQAIGGNINRRNNAMSDYAELLNEPDLMAKSSGMTVIQNGKAMEGSFMVNAKGLSRFDMYAQAQDEHKKITFSGRGLKDISKIQALDFLCANCDRHYGNMFYQVDNSDPDYLRIVGVQGIDNDASFGAVDYKGKGTSAYMSHLDDIKLIDADLAKEILALDPKKMEEKLHLADLSPEEVKAAHERLAAMQEKIRNNGIVQLSSDEEWEHEVNGKSKVSSGLFGGNHSFDDSTPDDPKFSHLAYDSGASCNIYQLAYEVCNKFNKEPAPQFQQDRLPQFHVGKGINIQEATSLSSQYEDLTSLQEQLSKITYRSLLPMKVQLSQVITTMGEDIRVIRDIRKNDESPTSAMLSDKQRNELSQQLKDLQNLANQYAADHRADEDSQDQWTRDGLHYAKRLGAHAGFVRDCVQSDAIEAEKNLASHMAEDLRQKSGLQKSAVGFTEERDTVADEYAAFGAQISQVDKSYIRSSKEFKAMLKAYRDVEKSDDKAQAYQDLADAAQQYLNFKVPEGKKVKLSDYAQSRVDFARELMEFSNRAHKQEMFKAESQKNNFRQDAKDAIDFNNRCAKIVNDYTNAAATKDPEKIKQYEDTILSSDKAFFKDYEHLVQISEKYSKDHPIQMVLHDLMIPSREKPSAIDAFANLHAKLYNEKNGTKERPYATTGVSSLFAVGFQAKLKEIGQAYADRQEEAAKHPIKVPKAEKSPVQQGGMKK